MAQLLARRIHEWSDGVESNTSVQGWMILWKRTVAGPSSKIRYGKPVASAGNHILWPQNPRTCIHILNISNYDDWLVVWDIFYFSIYWECHNPNWRTHMFQRGRSSTNQYDSHFVSIIIITHHFPKQVNKPVHDKPLLEVDFTVRSILGLLSGSV